MNRWVAGFILLAAVLLQGCASSEADREIALIIRKQLTASTGWFQKRATVDDDDIQPLVRRFYKARRYSPAWIHIDGPNGEARQLLEQLTRVAEHGLNPEDYDYERIEVAMKKTSGGPFVRGKPSDLAALDIELTRNFLKLGTHLSSGQVNPLQLPADWHLKPAKPDMVKVLEEAIGKNAVGGTLASLAPEDPQYEGLRKALVQYRQIQEAGGWPVVPSGRLLKRGSSGERVLALQKRLAASGDLGRYAPGRFDAGTEAGVRRFQLRHGLEEDGKVGSEDVSALNLPVSHRIRQIELNMERWRWVPDSLMRGRYLMVNIPNYTLNVVEGKRTALAMRVVVGKEFSRTPMFTDEISYMVFNPVWNVPSSIATAEILEEVRRDPSYLARNNMRVFQNETNEAVEVDPASIDWNSLSAEDFRYAFRQDPGPENPVGHVKFMCPNQFNVYLHDTPAENLFSARERSFSHGCIRVERPIDLAVYLLHDRGWNADSVAAAFETADNSSVKIPEPLPLLILYWTAFVDDRGVMQFRDDVYGIDQLLDRSLRKQRPDIKSPVRTA